MRKDMAQLLVEHPRHNAGELYRVHRRTLNRDLDAPTKQGMRRPYVERKEFGEYFAPLMGYLRKNIGRPWDKVFSELNASLTGGGTVIDHVKMHLLRDFVTLEPVWHNGEPCYPFHNFHSRYDAPVPINGKFNRGFYVDQRGLLKQARPKRRKIDTLKLQRVTIDENSAYHKLEGHWYRVWTKTLEAPSIDSVPVYDVLLKKWVKSRGRSTFFHPEMVWSWNVEGSGGLWELKELHGSGRIAYRKEQISNRTIRREKLNDLL